MLTLKLLINAFKMFDITLLMLLISPVFFVCILIEYCRYRQHYHLWDSILNTLLALAHQFADALALLLLLPLFSWLHQYRLFDFELSPLTLLCGFILQDFLYYWFHRACHYIHWFWSAHVVHHSSTYMNFSTAFRQSLLYPVVGMWLFWLPLVLLGFTAELVFTIVSINLAYQFFIHTQTLGKLWWLESIINTPTHHRIHHASNPAYIDKNFAGVFIIWDKLFGTFASQQDDIEIQYGIRGTAPEPHFVAVNFAQWCHMLRQARQAKGIIGKCQALFGYPTHLPERKP